MNKRVKSHSALCTKLTMIESEYAHKCKLSMKFKDDPRFQSMLNQYLDLLDEVRVKVMNEYKEALKSL